jgi:hypothetical protein
MDTFHTLTCTSMARDKRRATSCFWYPIRDAEMQAEGCMYGRDQKTVLTRSHSTSEPRFLTISRSWSQRKIAKTKTTDMVT